MNLAIFPTVAASIFVGYKLRFKFLNDANMLHAAMVKLAISTFYVSAALITKRVVNYQQQASS